MWKLFSYQPLYTAWGSFSCSCLPVIRPIVGGTVEELWRDRAAAWFPKAAHAIIGRPDTRPHMNPLAKQSPAPDTETTFLASTDGGAKWSPTTGSADDVCNNNGSSSPPRALLRTITKPCLPIVTISARSRGVLSSGGRAFGSSCKVEGGLDIILLPTSTIR